MGTAKTDLVLTAVPAWRRWLLLVALLVLGGAYIAAYGLFLIKSRNFIDVQRNQRAADFAGAHSVALPAHLTFSEGQLGAGTLGGGWYNPEAGGVWSASSDTWIYLSLAQVDSDLELQLNAHTFIVRHHSRIHVSVDVNDAALGSWERSPANAIDPMRMRIPQSITRVRKLIIHLHIDKPASPRQVGSSDDFRQLGVFLTSVDLAVASEAPAREPNVP